MSAAVLWSTLACGRGAVPAPAGNLATTRSAAAIIEAFSTHPIVLLGETHQSAAFYAFAKQLVGSPGFTDVVDDIVIESGNVRFQPVLDRYIAGQDVPKDSLKLVWRETTQLLAWDSDVYADFLAFVRSLNQGLPASRRLRVLAGDPPLDWARIRSADDFPPTYGYRDWQMVDVLEREVLDRRRHALVIVGATHVYRQAPGPDSLKPPVARANVADALHRMHPGVAYSVATVVGTGLAPLRERLAAQAMPGEIVPLRGTVLGRENASLLFGRDITLFRVVNGRRVTITLAPADMPSLETELDALLYLGPVDHKVPPHASTYRSEPAYLAEVRRRIIILAALYGGDFWTDDLDAILSADSPAALRR